MIEAKHAFLGVVVLAMAFMVFMFMASGVRAAPPDRAYGCGPTGCAGNAMLAGSGAAKEFVIKATKFAFTPSAIKVNKGDRVRLTLQNVDGTHGLSIPEYGVNLQPAAGQSQTADFVADKAGTFNFACTVYCGSGHLDMAGNLVVNGAGGSQAQEQVAAPTVQEVSLRATQYGYTPPNLNVKVGQPVKFDFSADSNVGCGRQVIIDGVNVNLVSRNGETQSATFTLSAPGQYRYHCPMNMFQGVLTAS